MKIGQNSKLDKIGQDWKLDKIGQDWKLNKIGQDWKLDKIEKLDKKLENWQMAREEKYRSVEARCDARA